MMSQPNRFTGILLRMFLGLLGLLTSLGAAADTNLADAPIGSKIVVPANVILDLSVEFPTAVGDAYYTTGTYTTATEFTGYFNPNFCYDYVTGSAYTGSTVQFGVMVGYFSPVIAATTHGCSGLHWSGNFLNWVLTQTIDPLRKALTGGARIVDTASTTILQKAYQDNQGGTGNQAVKILGTAALVKGATPFTNWSTLYVNNLNTGLNFVFSRASIASTIRTGTNFVGVPVLSANNNSGSNSNYSTNNTTYQVQSAVQVCSSVDASADLDTSPGGRCRAYGSNYKPVGLMQKYAAENTTQIDSIRYSAFGYLNDPSGTDNNQKMDGGVMRARMKSVGPYMANPGTLPSANVYNATTNPYGGAEWSSTGQFVVNPNSTDSAATIDPTGAVANSGVINYLNKFGFSAATANPNGNASAYKRYDSVGELYYAATRYYRNLGNVPSYTTNPATAAGEATNDNFPVITAWDDPIRYSCANNYIIGIGDIHTWNDANVPGNTITGNEEPTKPTEVSTDTAVNARTQTNFIANLEHLAGYTGKGDGTQNNSNDYSVIATLGDNLIGSIASPSGGWGASQNTFYMAGLAYDVHTRDIRPDITPKNNIVTVSTFWLDVMENNDYHEKNQFWMTAKYGGFDTSNKTAFPSGYSETGQTTALPTAVWNSSYVAGNSATGYRDDRGNLLPDQYFQAGNPAAMAAGLDSAFKKIASSVPVGISSALSLGSSTLNASGNANYVTSYAKDWSGDMVAQTLTPTNTNGVISTIATQIWDAHNWLPPTTTSTTGLPSGITPLTYATRIIATSSAVGATHGVAFRMSGISSAEKLTLGSGTTVQTNMLNYLRGDASNESATGFRPRAYVLGDITDSQPAVIGVPSAPYADAPLNPGYSAFKAAHSANIATSTSDRPTVVYIGANDGMLHAFDGTISTTGGKELFAYVPSYLFNTNVDANNNPVGLASLAVNPLQHHFLVDAQPVVYDVDFDWTNTAGAATNTATTGDWHTIVISGLGKGGKGFFALDVTDPTAINSETALAGKVLWETDTTSADFAHMGYSYGKPQIAKTAKYGWTLFLTSGYGNDDGKGYIYLVNPKNGTLYERIATGAGDTTNPAGLAQVNAFIPSAADFTADSLYGGDLLGNVWRLDLTGVGSLGLQKLATLTDASSNPQPVTTQPDFGIDSTLATRYVFVGTGRLLADTDLVSANPQTFYAIQDGTNAAFSTSTTTLTRSNLVDHSSIASLSGSTTAGVTIPASGAGQKFGFYIDLPVYAASAGLQASDERINVNPIASGGAVAFASNLFGRDVCGKGSSHGFALSYNSTLDSSGNPVIGSSLLQISGSLQSYFAYSTGVVTNVALVSLNATGAPPHGGGMTALFGLDTGNLNSIVSGGQLKDVVSSLVRLNWREVPSSD